MSVLSFVVDSFSHSSRRLLRMPKSVNEISKLHPGGPQVSLPALFGSSTGGDCWARRVSPLAGGADSGMLWDAGSFGGHKRVVPIAFF